VIPISSHPAARLKEAEAEYLLYTDKVVRIGRSIKSDLVVDDLKVSRNHALIEWDGASFTLRDLGSSNGSYINGKRLSDLPQKLQDGDQIVIYKKVFTFEQIQVEGSDVPAAQLDASSTLDCIYLGPRLLVLAGPDASQEFVLWGDRVTIGRSSRNATWEIRLADRAVSRPHCCLQREDETYTLIDLRSANGTLLNGLMISAPVVLKSGDEITLGDTRLVFQS
jgi:pSer/pThr/pTyr-binding forkhead associated (FHA) protein